MNMMRGRGRIVGVRIRGAVGKGLVEPGVQSRMGWPRCDGNGLQYEKASDSERDAAARTQNPPAEPHLESHFQLRRPDN